MVFRRDADGAREAFSLDFLLRHLKEWGGTGFLFDQVLVREGIAVLHVDNRGMAGRGQKFAAAIRHDFGDLEIKDQNAAVDQTATGLFSFMASARGYVIGSKSSSTAARVALAPIGGLRSTRTALAGRIFGTVVRRLGSPSSPVSRLRSESRPPSAPRPWPRA